MDNIITAKHFDINKINYGQPKMLESGGKAIYMGYSGKPLYIQTPEMTAPFGMTKWNNDKGDAPDKYTIELSFKGRESKQSIDRFYNMLETIDKKVVADALENSTAWFKKKYTSVDVVEALYTPLIKHPKDKSTGEITDKYPPTFRLNIPYKDSKFTCEVFNDKREITDLSAMETKGSKVTAIIQCLGLWCAGGKFGCSWKVVQLRVVPPATIKGFAFKDDENEDKIDSDIEDDSDDVNEKDIIDNTVADDDDCIVESSDEEDDEVDEKQSDVKTVVLNEDEDDELDSKTKTSPKSKTVKVVKAKK